MSAAKVLIAGIGNIFHGDDAFGSEVARRLLSQPMPPQVRVVDFGIRGIDLTYALTNGCETAILIDAVHRDGPPGTLYVIEPTLDGQAAPPIVNAHTLDPATVLRSVQAMGGPTPRVLLVGCEPENLGGEDGCMGLSAPVEAAVPQAMELVNSLVENLLQATRTQT